MLAEEFVIGETRVLFSAKKKCFHAYVIFSVIAQALTTALFSERVIIALVYHGWSVHNALTLAKDGKNYFLCNMH